MEKTTMAKIVYGVAGEGSGHSSRAREIASHLRDAGHDLWLASYDRGYRNLCEEFRVLEIEGLCIGSEDNRVSLAKTITENLKRLPAGNRAWHRLREQLFDAFQPDCVITDFEPMTAYLAQQSDLPLITLDNQHRMRYLEYECPPGLEFDSQVTLNIIRAMVPWPDVSLVTAFCPGKTTNDRTFVFPPILRQELFACQPRDEGHVLVYVTRAFDSLINELQRLPREHFMVYGFDRTGEADHLTYKPFSRQGFLDDLASAKAVIATAGFTLISEALFLRKPYLALPMQGQFEQELNAFQLAQLGYGKRVTDLTAESIGDFLYRLPDYRSRLAQYQGCDAAAIEGKLDELLADDCRLARQFHAARQR
jgi:uncharacterized protein (TIGR00661 family)